MTQKEVTLVFLALLGLLFFGGGTTSLWLAWMTPTFWGFAGGASELIVGVVLLWASLVRRKVPWSSPTEERRP